MRALPITLLVLLALGCGRTPIVETQCNGSTQCPLDRVCVESVCVIATELTLITEALPNARINVPYEARIEARGGQPAYRFTLGAGAGLPAGLSLFDDGTIRGTPTQAGGALFTAIVEDEAGNVATRDLLLLVDPESGAALRVTTEGLPQGTVGSEYQATLSAEGGAPPYVWTVAAGVLPSGLVLSPSGELSGTPTTAGSAQIMAARRRTPSPSPAARCRRASRWGPTAASAARPPPAARSASP